MSLDPRIVLASSSPRRRALLDQIRVPYICAPAAVDEALLAGESPQQYVQRLAGAKSMLVRQQMPECQLPVIGADTAVVLDGAIMGKPQGLEQAVAMLSQLSGRRHQVLSAVSVRARRHWQALNVTSVGFRPILREEMLAYWATGEPADKAGAYAIQGLGALFVDSIEGSYSGVVGLPLFETAALLEKAGISPLRSEPD
jgi:septum formation protein